VPVAQTVQRAPNLPHEPDVVLRRLVQHIPPLRVLTTKYAKSANPPD
jgi:hypothetical protein